MHVGRFSVMKKGLSRRHVMQINFGAVTPASVVIAPVAAAVAPATALAAGPELPAWDGASSCTCSSATHVEATKHDRS